MSEIFAGSTVFVDLDIVDVSNAPIDATTLRVLVLRPNGSSSVFTYGTDPDIVRLSTGKYRLAYYVTSEGPHRGVVMALVGTLYKRSTFSLLASATAADVAFPP